MGLHWRHTPESDLIRKEGRMSLENLAQRSDKMARNIMASPKLINEVNVHIQGLLSGTIEQRESLGADIASRHPEAIPETMEDRRERAALVLRVAELIDDKRRHGLH